MMWPLRRKSTVKPDPAARDARIRAERELEQQLEETSRVEAMTASWRRIRERNHFAPAIESIFRGGN